MSQGSQKRIRLTLRDKVEVLNSSEREKLSVRSLAAKFEVGRTQINEILKNKNKILKSWAENENELSKRAFPKTQGLAVDNVTYDWYCRASANNIPVSGTLIQEKALEIARQLGLNNFKASRGWLHKFRTRHSISGKNNVFRETSCVDEHLVLEWRDNLQDVCQGFIEINSVDAIVNLYRNWASLVQSPKSAFLRLENTGKVSLETVWTVRDLVLFEQSNFTKHYQGKVQNEGKLEISQVGFPYELGNEGLSAVSPSGLFRAVLRKVSNEPKGSKKHIIEIWNSASKIKSFDLHTLDVHGDVCEDGQFGCMQWSYNENQLLYIAEKKMPKAESYFNQKAQNTLNKLEETSEQGIGQYREEWGEQLVGCHHPIPCILNIETGKVKILNDIPENLSCGQAIWAPNDAGIIFVGWNHEPRRLGLIFCNMRKNTLYHLDYENKNLTPLYDNPDWCVRSPTISPDQKILIFMDNKVGGPHCQCSRLLKFDWSTKQCSVLVDIVHSPKRDEFPGLYLGRLPKRCWSQDSSYVLCESIIRSKIELIAIKISDGMVTRLTNDFNIGSWHFLDISQDYIVAARSSPNIKPHLAIGFLTYKQEGKQPGVENWHLVESFEECYLEGIEHSIYSLQPKDSIEESMEYEVLVSKPVDISDKLPLIIIPHGGPHSTVTSQFLLAPFLYNKLGYATAIINYRGSLGFGQKPLESLLGKVGDQDIKDTHQATLRLMLENWVDVTKIAVSGGSHGGFIATHLIGQYPDTYKVCICRNPVVDLAGKLEGTDIPDWGWTECGLNHSLTSMPTPDVLKIMWEKSPFQYLPKVKAALLMLVSKDDLRVPPTQGKKYYNALKALGTAKTKLQIYEGDHSQSKVDVESDSFVKSVLWLSENMYD